MYTISITSNSGREFSRTYVDPNYAIDDFFVGMTCIDLKYVCVYDATTGELYADYDGKELAFY